MYEYVTIVNFYFWMYVIKSQLKKIVKLVKSYVGLLDWIHLVLQSECIVKLLHFRNSK